jgi:hypothetical protein
MRLRSVRRLLQYTLLFGFLVAEQARASQDTVLTSHTQRTNLSFNTIYRENVTPGFFGNEYGNPIRTSLVADINPNVLVLNSAGSRFFVLFSPRVKLRLLNARKAPVRSPSYMPGLKMYSRMNGDIDRPQFLSLAYSHHSNGQDGPTLQDDGRFNRGEGKFTTNYYTLDYTRGKRETNSIRSKTQYTSLGLEIHTGLFNLGYSKELENQYGFVRMNVTWLYDLFGGKPKTDKYSMHHRIHARASYIIDKYEDYSLLDLRKRANIGLQYSYQPGFTGNVALTLGAGYRGQDDYNIYFEDSYFYASFGILYGVAFDLRKKSPTNTIP